MTTCSLGIQQYIKKFQVNKMHTLNVVCFYISTCPVLYQPFPSLLDQFVGCKNSQIIIKVYLRNFYFQFLQIIINKLIHHTQILPINVQSRYLLIIIQSRLYIPVSLPLLSVRCRGLGGSRAAVVMASCEATCSATQLSLSLPGC